MKIIHFLFTQKTAPDTASSKWGGKNRFLFLTGARSLQNRSYASGGTRYLQADLMLLTHARCAFKDPHGCFGISMNPALRCREQEQSREMKSVIARCAEPFGQYGNLCSDFSLDAPQFRTAALRSNRQYGAAAFRTRCRCGKCPCQIRPENYLYSSTRRVRCS